MPRTQDLIIFVPTTTTTTDVHTDCFTPCVCVRGNNNIINIMMASQCDYDAKQVLTLPLWMKMSTAFESTASAFWKQMSHFSIFFWPANILACLTKAPTHICINSVCCREFLTRMSLYWTFFSTPCRVARSRRSFNAFSSSLHKLYNVPRRSRAWVTNTAWPRKYACHEID